VLARLLFGSAIRTAALRVKVKLAHLSLAVLAQEPWVQSAVDVVRVTAWG